MTPNQTPAATDSRFFRERGVKAHGLNPGVFTRAEVGTMHGIDERISVHNLATGARIVY